MEIKIRHKIIRYNRGNNDESYEYYYAQYNTETMISDIIKEHTSGSISLDYYYNLSLKRSPYDFRVPFVISCNNEVVWNGTIDDIKVVDFTNTHSITQQLEVTTLIAEIGGPNKYMTILEIWNACEPIIIEVSKILGITFTFHEAYKRIKEFFTKKRVSPLNVFEYIYTRDSWNHKELAHIMNLDSDDVKKLLKVSGYKWNNRTKQYDAFNTEEVRKKLEKISVRTTKY